MFKTQDDRLKFTEGLDELTVAFRLRVQALARTSSKLVDQTSLVAIDKVLSEAADKVRDIIESNKHPISTGSGGGMVSM